MKNIFLETLILALVSTGCTRTSSSPNQTSTPMVTTFAGSGVQGSANGTATAASFYQPNGITVDADGNVFVNDMNNLIRKISPSGLVSQFVGGASGYDVNGTGISASFSNPEGMAVDVLGNIYVADGFLIRKINISGLVTTIAGNVNITNPINGIGTSAGFLNATGVAVDSARNLYVADQDDDLIRKISPTGLVTTLAGSGVPGSSNGIGTSASFNEPVGVAIDRSGNIYVADQANELIRKISPLGEVSTLAGNGTSGSANGIGTAASFNNPCGVAVDNSGNVYVADEGNNLIRKITPLGVVTTFAGNGSKGSVNGSALSASFNGINDIAIDASGNIYVSDGFNNLIRKITQ